MSGCSDTTEHYRRQQNRQTTGLDRRRICTQRHHEFIIFFRSSNYRWLGCHSIYPSFKRPTGITGKSIYRGLSMKSISCKVLVIGAGPGGYVAAIRAGQLGLDTVIVESDRTGGTCLIRGCIPSKALIHAATRYEELCAHANEEKLGISLSSKPELNLAKTMAWKDCVVDKLNGGVEALLKKAGVNIIKGWANFLDAKTCTVDTADGVLSIKAEHVILANGSSATLNSATKKF